LNFQHPARNRAAAIAMCVASRRAFAAPGPRIIPLSKSVTSPVLSEAKKQGAVIGWGNFLTVAVNFLIIAFVLFPVVRAINNLKK
jgi:large-conductance mechanosensitive channel